MKRNTPYFLYLCLLLSFFLNTNSNSWGSPEGGSQTQATSQSETIVRPTSTHNTINFNTLRSHTVMVKGKVYVKEQATQYGLITPLQDVGEAQLSADIVNQAQKTVAQAERKESAANKTQSEECACSYCGVPGPQHNMRTLQCCREVLPECISCEDCFKCKECGKPGNPDHCPPWGGP